MAERASKSRGRVVLQMRGGRGSPIALEAAFRMARSLESELEGLFVEDEHLLSLAAMPFAREVSFTGRRTRPLSEDLVRREMRAASAAMHREFERLARAVGVPARYDVVRDEPERALRSASAAASVLAIGEPVTAAGRAELRAVTACLSEMTACLLVGREARRARGRIVVALDAFATLPPLVRMAERIARDGQEEIVAVLAGETVADRERAVELVRSLVPAVVPLRIEAAAETEAALGEVARRLGGGLVIAGLGGTLLPGEAEVVRLTAMLECPLLLSRGAGEEAQPDEGSTSART
ncbi:MAG: hypothetical protein MI824_21105 [Hyphomicrobiales bacterium]|nr:hypothetical protein [Hyphomicrobiales bacterium]